MNNKLFLELISNDKDLLNSETIIEINQQYFRVSKLKLKDLNGTSYLVSLLNITDTRLFEKKQLLINFVIIFIILTILYFVYKNFKKTIHEKNILITKTNKSLEQKVVNRTKKLTEANEKLNETLHNLTQTKKDLVSAQKMAALGELVTSITHEINSPLGVSITTSSHISYLTNEIYELNKKEGLSLEEFESFVNSLEEMSKILDINLNNTKKLVSSFKNIAIDQALEEQRDFEIKEYISEILLSLKSKIRERKINIAVQCDENLVLNSYPGSFGQILTNLINNSLLHGFEQNDEGEIKISINDLENEIEMIYQDNGKGIPLELSNKVFNQYFTTKKGTGGTGLGLYIIKDIVTEKLNGNIEISALEEKGVKFLIKIPKIL